MAKVLYRGHEISVGREKSQAGYALLYYSISRRRDQLECLSSFEDSAEKVRDKVEQLKRRIDSELESDDPWDQKAKSPAGWEDDGPEWDDDEEGVVDGMG